MGTPLQDIYTRYQSKLNENLVGQESLIFEFLKSSISKSYKTVRHSLAFVLADIPITIPPTLQTYDGYFNDTLDEDEIEYIAMWMINETKRRRKEKLEAQKVKLGTKDFNQLPDKVKEFNALGVSMKDLREEINELKQEFNTYNY